MQAGIDLDQQAAADGSLRLGELQLVEEGLDLGDGQGDEVGDGAPAHTDVERSRLEACAAAGGAHRAAAITRQQDAVLNLIHIALHKAEEVIDAPHARCTVPEQLALRVGQVVVGAMDREVAFAGSIDEATPPFVHHLAPPASDGALINREVLVRDDEPLVYVDHHAETLAAGAGAEGVIEVEHRFRRLLEGDPVGLEAFGEFESLRRRIGRRVDAQAARLMPLVKGRLDGVSQTVPQQLVVRHCYPIDEQIRLLSSEQLLVAHHLLHAVDAAADLEPRVALLLQDLELLLHRPPLGQHDGRVDGYACTGRV